MLIDIYTAVGSNHWDDGIHLNAQGLKDWYDAIACHAKENHLRESSNSFCPGAPSVRKAPLGRFFSNRLAGG